MKRRIGTLLLFTSFSMSLYTMGPSGAAAPAAPRDHLAKITADMEKLNLDDLPDLIDLDILDITEEKQATTEQVPDLADLYEEFNADTAITPEMSMLFLFGTDYYSEKFVTRCHVNWRAKCLHVTIAMCFNGYCRVTPSRHFLHNRFFCSSNLLGVSDKIFHNKFLAKLEENNRSCSIWLTPDQKQPAQQFTKNGYVPRDQYTVMTTNICDNKFIEEPSPKNISCKNVTNSMYCNAATKSLGIDREDIRLFVKNIQEDIGSDFVAFYCATSIYTSKSIEEFIASQSSCMVIYHPEERTIVIHFLATPPDQDHEITRTLIRHILNDARSNEYAKAVALVPSSAKNLYEQLGFTAGNVYTMYTKPDERVARG